MRILVLCDDFWHPAKVVRTGMQPLEQSGFAIDWIEDATEFSPDLLKNYPLVVLSKSNNVSAANKDAWVTDDVQQALAEYVRQGKGLLVIHSGTAGYKDTPVLRGLLGGVFDQHPPQLPVTMTPKEGHPLTSGSSPFTVQDEHYFMEMDDVQADVFMTTESEHGSQPGGWTRTEGKGRVCVLTPGHNVEVWLHPSFQALLKNALTWCAQKETA